MNYIYYIIITAVTLIALLVCWYINGRDKISIKTMEPIPPCNPIQMGYMLDGWISERVLLAAILHWERKGYLNINGKHIHINEAPPEGYEFTLFNATFGGLKSAAFAEISVKNTLPVEHEVKESLNEKYSAATAPLKSIENYIYAAAWLLMGPYSPTAYLIFLLMNWIEVVVLKRILTKTKTINMQHSGRDILPAVLLGGMTFAFGPMLMQGRVLPATILYIVGTFLLALMDKRSNTKLYGRILGYGKYLREVEYPKFTELRKSDRHYGEDELPYLVLFDMGTDQTREYVRLINLNEEDKL